MKYFNIIELVSDYCLERVQLTWKELKSLMKLTLNILFYHKTCWLHSFAKILSQGFSFKRRELTEIPELLRLHTFMSSVLTVLYFCFVFNMRGLPVVLKECPGTLAGDSQPALPVDRCRGHLTVLRLGQILAPWRCTMSRPYVSVNSKKTQDICRTVWV